MSARLDGLLDAELVAVAERLRAVTVRITGRGRRGRGSGSGSGILWRPGVVVTNAHVAGSRSGPLAVESAAGAVAEGRLVARDPRQDLAVLSVEPELQPLAVLERGEPIRVGELVLAVGNPPGLDGALTTGIVHAVVTPRRGAPLILADLRLVPGNSGGPLGDVTGRVVGINAMLVRGLAAAIPSEVVERFLERARLAA
jgi:serine protease Do